MNENADQAFVETVVKAIVDHPDDVKTNRSVDEMGVLIELTVNPEDMGKIIGKEGRTAKSIRTLLRVLGAKNNARVNLKIIEPEGGKEVKATEETPAESPAEEKSLEEGQATEVV
ncbi:TPA: KH domain-containing protein [Candidatus Berkelbacteria bacterium]|uniref:RNA-binding protein KhpA n=1 Tax=Berkelbacteria bacterium GW2011_GWE1_39_12 TaxID=1618337 RepID=A0A0G4B4L4_9BACT|nr:MAG: hypothetical protein UT28_C0001G0775 [Berkelbacteria bacterium GW2011_GWE1_39_12]HBO60356.1 KH domain-containing protein [Candidatus Berkelbacteria bacterium]